MQEQRIIELKDKIVTLNITQFDGDLDVENLVKIDYSNILGEILTFPVVFNRIMNLKADMKNIVSESLVDFEAFEANLGEFHRARFADKGKKATIPEVNNAVLTDQSFIDKKKEYHALERDLEYIDSLYWAAHSKTKLLEKISEKLRPSDFEGELLDDTINGVIIKSKKKAIQ